MSENESPSDGSWHPPEPLSSQPEADPPAPSTTGGSQQAIPLYDSIEHVNWRPDDNCSKQTYIFEWMESVINDKQYGPSLREWFTELLPPETLFAREVIQGGTAPRMYKDLRDLIHARGGSIEKRRGLQIKRALALFYSDEQSVKDATDLAREVVEQGINTLASRRLDLARYSPPVSERGAEPMEASNQTLQDTSQATQQAAAPKPRSFGSPANADSDGTEQRQDQARFAPYRQGKPGPSNQGIQDRSFVPLHRRNTQMQQATHRSHTTGPQEVSSHAINVLSKLATRFKDRADKFGGDDGENWEDVYGTYMNCVTQWGVPENAALRNIENILAGQARTYYKRKVQANPQFFKTCKEVDSFMMSTFHGQEAQEATLEYLSSLSMYELVKERGSFVEGLKAVRDAIVKHVNLVPRERQTDEDQRRWLKNAVRSYKWTRATNARAHELDFARLYSTLKCQAIEEDRGREVRANLERDRFRSRVGDKSLGKTVYYGDVYGRGRDNPRHKPYVPGERKFNGNCYGCGARGYRRADCPKCKAKTGYAEESKKAMRAIHETTTLSEMGAVVEELCIQYGEDWMETLAEGREDDIKSETNAERQIRFAEDTDYEAKDDSSSSSDEDHELDEGFASQFGIHFLNDDHPNPDHGPSLEQVNCHATKGTANENALIPDEAPILPIHASSEVDASVFEGVCLDTGASTSVCGLRQAQAYACFIGCKLAPTASRKVFKFGSMREKSLGTVKVRLPFPKDSYVEINVDIVSPNIPLLIGLDALDKYGLYVNNVQNLLVHDKVGWGVPLVRQGGHMYYKWPAEVCFTMTELRKMHQGFYHPSSDKLLNLIKRAKPEDATPEARKILQEISERCKTCQYRSPKPRRFTASIPDGVIFNRTVILDLMWILGKPVLHVVDRDTHYSAARFLNGETVEDVWHTFLLCWVATYSGYPDSVRSDAGSVFTSKSWSVRTAEVGVAVEVVPVESSNSMGIGERYHDPLRRIYRKILMDHPGHPREVILALANKAMNDTMGPEGLVPSLLVFGSIPRVSAATNSLPDQEARLSMMQTARDEMESITARLRLRTVLRTRTPKSTHAILTEGDPVLVWRKKGKASESLWTGPFEVLKIEGKVITVSDDYGKAREYNASSVKLYTSEDVAGEYAEEDEPADLDENGLADPESSESESESDPDSLDQDPDYDPYYAGYWEEWQDDFYSGYDSGADQWIYLTETLPFGDARGRESRFNIARRKEIEGLESMGTWERVDESQLPHSANVLGSRFALAIKQVGTEKELAKARLVAQGHTDREKFNVVHDSTTLHQRSIRLIASLASMYGFAVWAHDITQAYLQSDSPLQRNVYLRPPPELRAPKGQLLKLIKPLYGLTDSGDYWGSTNTRHHTMDLGMRPTCGDLSLYFRREEGKLVGLSGVVVDDTLQAGTAGFYAHTRKTMDRFKSKERQLKDVVFAGVHVDKVDDGGFRLSQSDYGLKLKQLAPEATYQELRSNRAKLAWLTNTRPDISCAVAKLAQVTEGTFGPESVKAANKVIAHVRKSPTLGIHVPKLNRDTTSIVVLTDAALANNEDLSSQIGFVIALTDGEGKANLIEYSSRKCRRVTHSSLAGEIMAFSAGFDAGYIIKHDLEMVTKRRIPMFMMTDSRGLFDMVTRNTYSAERRLMVDMAAIRQAYQKREIDGIAHVAGVSNPADAMTKIVQSGTLLDLMSGRMTVTATQWVMRRHHDA